ncbi:MAG: hypothetical protein ACO3A4_14580 [Silvanigrellaceae bacterium]
MAQLGTRAKWFSLALLVSAEVLSGGCVKRSFNTIDQAKSGGGKFNFTPLTRQQFEEALYSGVMEGLSFFTPTELKSFFDDFAIDELKGGNKKGFFQALFYESPIEWSLSRINSTPMWISRKGLSGIPEGGLVLLGRDLFPEGFFRNMADQIPLQDLMTKSPWFEWDDEMKVFRPRRGGASERILNGLFTLRGPGETFTLYRGAGMAMNLSAVPAGNPYESGQPEGKRIMFFSSPSMNTALAWANPGVWRSAVPREELLAGASGAQPTVYVGFEYNYPEIAFLPMQKLEPALLKSGRSQLLCVSEEKMKAMGDSAPTQSSAKFCDPKLIAAHLSGFPDPEVEARKAVLKVSALIKMTAVPDTAVREGEITCRLKPGTEIEFHDAFAAPKGQVWIHSSGIDLDWDCPRSFTETKFYMDASKVTLSLSN